ncbi:MAG: isopentenyl phosphate kinase family protein [Candidatus Methanoplasma sp.]|jgi:isopentenyl phosphate kinase|nr:isopentenyl phosphate kinase family protein [Candidatus Methanoplasma sp.]
MILIKLGGSVITDKTQYGAFNRERTARLCMEIKESGAEALVVHGAGSFGHVLAKEFSIAEGSTGDPAQTMAAARVQHDVRRLSSMVVGELLACGIPAVSVPPGSCFAADGGRLIVGDAEAIRASLRMGIMPVLLGDVVMDRSKGFCICSGDQVMEVLCGMLEPERSVFVSDIDGLYDRDPKRGPGAKLIEEVTPEALGGIDSESSVADVTGGVRAKAESMLRMCAGGGECSIVNGTVPGRLRSILKGEPVTSTTARGGTRT